MARLRLLRSVSAGRSSGDPADRLTMKDSKDRIDSEDRGDSKDSALDKHDGNYHNQCLAEFELQSPMHKKQEVVLDIRGPK